MEDRDTTLQNVNAVKSRVVDLGEYAALRAWNALNASHTVSQGIQTLKFKSKSAIYRLEGLGPKGKPVIAKRCLAETAIVEHTIYSTILPTLPITSLCCYGTIRDDDPRFQWLFLEDAAGIPFNPMLGTHRRALAQWLGGLHAYSAGRKRDANLPDRGCPYYLEQLHQLLHAIDASCSTLGLKSGEQYVLQKLLSRCEFLESHWQNLEQRCAGISPAVVHGDLKEKNIGLRFTREGTAVLPFDWEIAGWGEPVTDLTRCPDFAEYVVIARSAWPHLTLDELRQLAIVGWIFRMILAIRWKCLSLNCGFPEWPMEHLNLYEVKLAAAFHSLDIL